jgi:hypothetical protein
MADTKLLCPKCGSDQLTANKKGFSGKKAVAGELLIGPVGLLAGTLGSNKIKITCLSCGHQFIPGQGATSQEQVIENKKRDKAAGKWATIILIGLLAVYGLSKLFDSNDKRELTPQEQAQADRQVDSMMNPDNYFNSLEADFIIQKTSQFKELINSEASAEEIKNKETEITRSFLLNQNDTLKDWQGEIAGIDAFKGKNSDIDIIIKSEEVVGQKTITTNGYDRTFDCHISIEALQGDRKQYGYKGIKREGELYEKLKTLKDGDKIIFSAKVVNSTDNTEKTGINLWTLLQIELLDIRKQ